MQAAVVSGIVAIVGGVVAGAFGIVDVELAKPNPQVTISTPAPTLTASASASLTMVWPGPGPTSPRPITGLVFSDRFCTAAGGWTVGNGHTGGQYAHCTFRIYANANDVESSEPRATMAWRGPRRRVWVQVNGSQQSFPAAGEPADGGGDRCAPITAACPLTTPAIAGRRVAGTAG